MKMVNSTAVGGGVAEMLRRIVPLLSELGVQVEWEVIKGDEPFFEITKAFTMPCRARRRFFPKRTFETYLRYNDMNEEAMRFDQDLIVIHDPQPAAMVRRHENRKNRWVWRCHIDLSHPNKQLWQIYGAHDRAIRCGHLHLCTFLPPAQDSPVSVLSGHRSPRRQEQGFDGRLRRRGIREIQDSEGQAHRYTDFKVRPLERSGWAWSKAFKMARKYVDCRLLLVGDKAADDPESDTILAQVKDEAEEHPDIHILLFSPSVAAEINAFQRGSDIVLQKSLREGLH
jgi:trehalose synthase